MATMDIKDTIEITSNCMAITNAYKSLEMVAWNTLSDADRQRLHDAKDNLAQVKMNLELAVLRAKKGLNHE